jgi:hypothetical protein
MAIFWMEESSALDSKNLIVFSGKWIQHVEDRNKHG